MRNVRIGTSGWSYPSGKGTWKGVFYPARPKAGGSRTRRSGGLPPSREASADRRSLGGGGQAVARTRKVDELTFYAEHFDTVEINSTFYRPPSPEAARGWAARTPAGFEFALKLYQKFTHPEMFAKATGKDPFDLTQADVDEFRRGIAPLADAGKLGPLLAQFPTSFKAEAATRDYLGWLLETFREYALAVELRHRSWSDDRATSEKILASHGAAWVQIDEPKFRVSVRQTFKPNVPGFYYMRLHGRNAANWWRHKASEDRYDYLYSEDELTPIADSVKEASRATRKAYVYMNNHFSAKSVANAAILKHKLGLELPGEYPPEMIERYPSLAGIVTVSSPLLRTSS